MPLDLSWTVLPAGIYNGTLSELEFKFGSVISLIIGYRIPYDGVDFLVSEWLTVDAPKTSGRYLETAQGKGRLLQLFKAHGLTLPAKLEPGEIIAKLVGKSFRLSVSTKYVNDLAAPRIAGVLGPADAPVPPRASDFPDEEEPV